MKKQPLEENITISEADFDDLLEASMYVGGVMMITEELNRHPVILGVSMEPIVEAAEKVIDELHEKLKAARTKIG